MCFHFKTLRRLALLLVFTGALLCRASLVCAQPPTPAALYQQAQAALEAENYAQAIPLLQQAVAQDGKNAEYQTALAKALNARAEEFLSRDLYADAAPFYREAAQLWEALGAKFQQAHNLHLVGFCLGTTDPHQALQAYHQAKILWEQLGAEKPEIRRHYAFTLNYIALTHHYIAEFDQAISYYEKAGAVLKASDDFAGYGLVLNNIGETYRVMGQKIKAEQYFKQGLGIGIDHQIAWLEGLTLRTVAEYQRGRKEYPAALKSLQRSLHIWREVTPRLPDEGSTLELLGVLHSDWGRYDEAAKYFQQARQVYASIPLIMGEATVLQHLGEMEARQGRYRRAIALYQQSLPTAVGPQYVYLRFALFNDLMEAFDKLNAADLAIVYGKIAVNILQQFRRNMNGFSAEVRKAFIEDRINTYQTLARLLIGEGRFAEAEEVLRMVQQEEFLEFVRRDPRGFKMVETGIDPVGEEVPAVAEQDRRLQSVASLSAEEWQLSGVDDPTAAQTARLAEVQKLLAEERQKLDAFWKALPARFARNAEDVEKDKNLLSAMQPLLAEMGRETGGQVAHVSTFVDDKGLELLLTGSSGATVHLSYAPDAKMLDGEKFPAWLNTRIFEFARSIQQRAPVNDKATALWNIIGCRGALERELKDRGVKTVMWRLTGPLRALPLAAMRDGEGFLVEKYRQVVLTAGSSDANLAHKPKRDWKALGLGVTGERKVEDLVFPALAGVEPELRAVVNAPQDGFTGGVLPGHVLRDGGFTANAFFRALRGATPDAPSPWQVIHIASHFKLSSDNLKSFLLTGDGSLTMTDLQKRAETNPLFPGVELMTLSACQTAAGGKGADSLGALAELNGAKSVLATLWPVADRETAQLMAGFYRRYEQNPDAGKAVALQQAQLELLKSGGKAAHPYFWAPFVLMGNWR